MCRPASAALFASNDEQFLGADRCSASALKTAALPGRSYAPTLPARFQRAATEPLRYQRQLVCAGCTETARSRASARKTLANTKSRQNTAGVRAWPVAITFTRLAISRRLRAKDQSRSRDHTVISKWPSPHLGGQRSHLEDPELLAAAAVVDGPRARHSKQSHRFRRRRQRCGTSSQDNTRLLHKNKNASRRDKIKKTPGLRPPSTSASLSARAVATRAGAPRRGPRRRPRPRSTP